MLNFVMNAVDHPLQPVDTPVKAVAPVVGWIAHGRGTTEKAGWDYTNTLAPKITKK